MLVAKSKLMGDVGCTVAANHKDLGLQNARALEGLHGCFAGGATVVVRHGGWAGVYVPRNVAETDAVGHVLVEVFDHPSNQGIVSLLPTLPDSVCGSECSERGGLKVR